MKVAIVSYNHPESSLPLAYYLVKEKKIDVDLYYIMSYKNQSHPIFEFSELNFKIGINKITEKNSIKELETYINLDGLNIYIILYPIISRRILSIVYLFFFF